ncbi:MAG: hypothetical protein LIQ26_01815 [Bacteroidota bacterium]|nr:hypothetical protein [Bacteroidota bacterium]
MKDYRFVILYLVFLIAQIVLCNFFGMSRYLMISVLPVLVLMLPLGMGNIVTMLIAFAIGFAVDFFSNGMLGITSLALVPVALVRRFVISIVFGNEKSARGEEITVERLGIPKIGLASLILCSLFFIIYVWVDSAGTAGFWAALFRIVLSVLVSTPVCVFAARLLRPS